MQDILELKKNGDENELKIGKRVQEQTNLFQLDLLLFYLPSTCFSFHGLPGSLFRFLLVFSIQISILRSQEVSCNSNDLMALKGFSSCLESNITSWNISSSDCCTWTGVTCDNSTVTSKRVISLELGGEKLTGTICESLASLDQLRILNLSHDSLRGSLTTKLFQMQNLKVLNLSGNYFVGPIPANTDLPSILNLNISKNSFSGTVDGNLCNFFPHIKHLDFSYNRFPGEVPAALGNCTSLQHLFLNRNNFTSNLPKSLFQLQHLNELSLMYFWEACLRGPINVNCSAMARLISLHLGLNNLHGPIPESLSSCPSLSVLNLGHNNLTALQILQNCRNLTILLLSENFQGEEMPDNVNLQFRNLSSLDVSTNHLGGNIPPWFNKFSYLFYVDLSNNSFSGKIPEGLPDLRGLIDMNISLEVPSASHSTELGQTVQHRREIPTGGQVMTFPSSSFEGNKGLCGRSLTPCQPARGPLMHPQQDEQMTVFGLQFGFGAVTGFVLTVAHCFMSGWVFPKES
ncbi:hypothetical protein SLEP1_g43690 [Rubroshorea leprosula]|uniref:Leucine-rich repeat-containing N-terminal plant-type domain-containing protein n=1 Tax=Rubroshorea leprosula TaxID=152421 RepID=A0AAV5LEV6_9ROSI|nr:hypothetical protein SLEP1_g43690 [Rubroshorea leprosula]